MTKLTAKQNAEITAKTAEPKKITGTRTAKPADKRGPKAGSAQSNQNVKLANEAKTSDTITEVKNVTSGGNYTVVSATGHKPLLIPSTQFVGNLTKLAQVGKSYKAVAELFASLPKPAAKMARGVDAQNSPHTAKAIADAKSAGAKHDPVAAKLAKRAKSDPTDADTPAKGKAPKADKPAKAAAEPKPAADRKYKATKLADNSKPDSFRTYMISTIRAHTTTNAAKAAHAASGKFSHERLNFKWAHDHGYIVLADLAK